MMRSKTWCNKLTGSFAPHGPVSLSILKLDDRFITMPAAIRVSVLGAGSSLKAFHHPSIQALPDCFVLHSVFERTDRGRARAICGEQITVVTTIAAVLNDDEVDLVGLQNQRY